MALTEDRPGEPGLEMAGLRRETARVREEVAGIRRDMKLLMWEFSIGYAGTFAGLGIIIAVVAP